MNETEIDHGAARMSHQRHDAPLNVALERNRATFRGHTPMTAGMECLDTADGLPDRVHRARVGRRGRGENGAALVEFALIAPLVFALLLGMFTGGMALSRKNSMTNAVRESARLGATLTEDSNWAVAVRDRAVALSGGDLGTSQVCVKLIRKTSSSTEQTRKSTPSSCPFGGEPSSAGIPVGECAVKVWAQRTSDMEVVFFSKTLTLNASSMNRYERAGDPATCGA